MSEIQRTIVRIIQSDPHARDCDTNRQIPFPCDCDVPKLVAEVAESVGIPMEKGEWGMGWRIVPRWLAENS